MRPEERDELLDWIAVVDPDWVEPMTRLIHHNPVFRDRFSLICRDDGRLIGHLMVVSQRTSIAGVPLRTGRVHWVAVDPSRQRQGIGKMMTNWWLERMESLGLELSWLVGIEGYYERFDYYYTFPSYDTPIPYTIRLNRPTSGPETNHSVGLYSVRSWNPDFSDATHKLFVKANRFTSCEIKHSPPVWRFLMGEVDRADSLEVIEDKKGRVVGLLWWRVKNGNLNLRYGLAADGKSAHFCIDRIWEIAHQHQLSQAFLHIPPDHPLGQAVLRRGGELRSPYHRTGPGCPGGMVRLNDPVGVLSKLIPVLSARLHNYGNRTDSTRLLLDLPGLQILLAMTDGRVEVISRPEEPVNFNLVNLSREALTQLVVGYREVRSLVEDRLIDGRDEDLELMEVLFPSGYPFLFMTV